MLAYPNPALSDEVRKGKGYLLLVLRRAISWPISWQNTSWKMEHRGAAVQTNKPKLRRRRRGPPPSNLERSACVRTRVLLVSKEWRHHQAIFRTGDQTKRRKIETAQAGQSVCCSVRLAAWKSHFFIITLVDKLPSKYFLPLDKLESWLAVVTWTG